MSRYDLLQIFQGGEGEVAALVPNLEELDLSENLITEWRTVAKIACQLCELEVLNLCSNRLSLPHSPEASPESRLDGLRRLILKSWKLSWPQVCSQCTQTQKIPISVPLMR